MQICTHHLVWCRLLTGLLHSDGYQCESVSLTLTSRPCAHWLWLHLNHTPTKGNIMHKTHLIVYFCMCISYMHICYIICYMLHTPYWIPVPTLCISCFLHTHTQYTYTVFIHKDKSHLSASWQPLCPYCCSSWCRRLMPQLLFQRHPGLKPFLCQETKQKYSCSLIYSGLVLVPLEYTNSCGWEQLQNVNASGILIDKREELKNLNCSIWEHVAISCCHGTDAFPWGVFKKLCWEWAHI